MQGLATLLLEGRSGVTWRCLPCFPQDQMCLMVADLLEFVPVSRDLRLAAGTGHRLRLAFSQSLGLYLGVYMHAPKRGQVWSNGGSSLRVLEVQQSSSEAVHKAKKTERFPGCLDGVVVALGGDFFVLQVLQGTCALALGVEFPVGLSSCTSCVLGMLPEEMCRGKGLKGAKSMETLRACVCQAPGSAQTHLCVLPNVAFCAAPTLCSQ